MVEDACLVCCSSPDIVHLRFVSSEDERACARTCMCVCLYTCVCLCLLMCTCMTLRVYTYMTLCGHVCICLCVCMSVCVYMYVHVYISVYVCLYVWVYVYKYTCPCLCTHVFVYVSSCMPCGFKYVCVCMCLYVYEHTCVCKSICVCGGAVCMYANFIAVLGFPENSSCRTLWMDPTASVLLSLLLLCCLSLPGSLQLGLQLKS